MTDKLTDRIATLPTEQLLEISLRLTLATTAEAVLVCNRVDRELERRLPEAEFIAHMDACEALMECAA
jgi:hypothetical protein